MAKSNLAFKCRMNGSYAKISKLIHESVTKDTMFKVPSKWHHLWQEFYRRYGKNIYRGAARQKSDLLGVVALAGKGGMLKELEALAEELFGK